MNLEPVTDLTFSAVTDSGFTISWTPPLVTPTTYLSYTFRLRAVGETTWWSPPIKTDFSAPNAVTSFTFNASNTGGGINGAGTSYEVQVLATDNSFCAPQSVTLLDP